MCKTGDRVKIDGRYLSRPRLVRHRESIAPAAGSEFSILPAQNLERQLGQGRCSAFRCGSRRSEVAKQLQLRAGMSVTVEIDTGHRRTLPELF